tara:strand:+ start:199 stop:522 length:324 start_codon:yes stop_codon:yes gene_type:complete
MMLRCFIIAAIALVVGVYCQINAYPDEFQIRINKKLNEQGKQVDEFTREAYGERYDYYKDPYAPDEELILVRNISFSIAGILLLVGIIIGPPKEGANAETQVVDPVE